MEFKITILFLFTLVFDVGHFAPSLIQASLATLCVDNDWPAGVHPHPTRCDKFIECSNGITNEMFCPKPLFFNPTKRVCDDPEVVKGCHKGTYLTTGHPTISTVKAVSTKTPLVTTRTSKTVGTSSKPTTPPFKSTSEPQTPPSTSLPVRELCREKNLKDGIHAHPYDCKKFVECSNSKTYVMPCGPGLFYDVSKKTCDGDPANSVCGSRGHTSTKPTTPPTKTKDPISELCRENNLENGIHAHPYDCKKFIECSYLKTYIMSCGAGLFYDVSKKTCDGDRANSVCGSRGHTSTKPTTPPTKTSLPVKELCREKNLKNGTHAHPYDCKKFIECSNSKTYVFTCGPGLFFDVSKKTCDGDQANSVCGSSVGGTKAPTTIPEKIDICAKYDLPNGAYPDPKNCAGFIECNAGFTFREPCPDGLNYDFRLVECNDVHKVNCQDNIDYYDNLLG